MTQYVKDNETYNGHYIHGDKTIIFNPTEEMLIAEGWTPVEDPQPTAEELLQSAKEGRLYDLTRHDTSEAVNSFTIGGTSIWLSFDERARIRQSIDAYRNTGRTEMTKWFGGKAFTFPLDTWQSMLDRLSVYASEALNVTEQHRAAIAALATVDEVNTYDITKGYPDKLVF